MVILLFSLLLHSVSHSERNPALRHVCKAVIHVSDRGKYQPGRNPFHLFWGTVLRDHVKWAPWQHDYCRTLRLITWVKMIVNLQTAQRLRFSNKWEFLWVEMILANLSYACSKNQGFNWKREKVALRGSILFHVGPALLLTLKFILPAVSNNDLLWVVRKKYRTFIYTVIFSLLDALSSFKW